MTDDHRKTDFPATHLLKEDGTTVICWESPIPVKLKEAKSNLNDFRLKNVLIDFMFVFNLSFLYNLTDSYRTTVHKHLI